ncbi:MAG: helix-turn-helix transcriptional regulator [Rhodoferax sp.]
MNNIKQIRERLKLTQAGLATELGMTQGNVSFYERGQMVPPNIAKKLIDTARKLGQTITFNDIYSPELGQSQQPQPTTECVAQEA